MLGGYYIDFRRDFQFICKDNAYSSKTYVYTYDNGGNILTKQTYAYTTGTLGTVQSRTNYGYGNSNWTDQLTSYNGTSITYDLSGNPLKWRNASAMNWTGRQLDSMTLLNGTTLSFLYNSDGLRVSKTVGSNTVKYRWDGTTLLAEEHTNYSIAFLYDGGTLMGFNYGGSNYYYGIDNLGVIHYVYNEAGTVVITYTYDAWGNTISASGDSSLISVNPIRYKSYYYDSETGLFYLQSRYYDPVVGRFISADDVEYLGTVNTVLSYNLYTYCHNNPIRWDDPSGHLVVVLSFTVGFAIYVGFSIMIYYMYDLKGNQAVLLGAAMSFGLSLVTKMISVGAYWKYSTVNQFLNSTIVTHSFSIGKTVSLSFDYNKKNQKLKLSGAEIGVLDASLGYMYTAAGKSVAYKFKLKRFDILIARAVYEYILSRMKRR